EKSALLPSNPLHALRALCGDSPDRGRVRIPQFRRPNAASAPILILLGLCLALVAPAQEPAPEWIWAAPGSAGESPDTVWFRRSFTTPPYNWNARLTAVVEGTAEIYLNGKRVASCDQPSQPVRAEVSMNLNQGPNLIAVRASRTAGAPGNRPAALLVHLNLGGSETRQLVTDTNWLVVEGEVPNWNKPGLDTAAWKSAHGLGPHGSAPWGDVLARASAAPAASLKLLPGFETELLRSAQPEEGSWVCLAFDPQGRAYLSPEGDSRPLLRLTFDPNGKISRVEPVAAPIRFAMGLLFAHGHLYANAKGPSGSGLYRLTDANHNDRFDADEFKLLKSFKGGGEHGYHALALGPDGRIHVLNGNGTRPPEGLAPTSPYRHFGEDLLSLNPDEFTRAGGALAPGCQVLRTDPDGEHWELVAGGMRNAFGFDFSPAGELFAYDSDNEWDWGTPWYRPNRLVHVVSGAEIGWRDGTRAWPDTYPDQVATVADIGIGSPTGVKFGTRARFPERYRRALFVQDWSYGRILAVHLEPSGATFRGTFEEFVKGQPLNLTSLDFGPDGSMYFTTGGRGTQSGLYRLRHTGDLPASEHAIEESTDPGTAARALRHSLERFHGHEHRDAVEAVWPHLGSFDPAIRFAARVALESQPVERWEPRVLAETNATTALTALLALARVGPASSQPGLLKTLARFPLSTLDESHRLLKYRVIELSFLRQGRPAPELVGLAISKLSPRFPAPTWAENRELTRLLLWLEAPDTVPRVLDLLDQAPSQEQQIHYVGQLRNVRAGWTPELRRRYLRWWLQPRDHLQRPASLLHWFHDVGRQYVDGANLDRLLEGFRRDAIQAIPESERGDYRDLTEPPQVGAVRIATEPRTFVRDWTTADILPFLDQASSGRNYERGRRAFIDAQCYACHRLGQAGAGIGPELTAVASKYGRREILESLLEPSKAINEQFRNVRVFLRDGDDLTGRLVLDSNDELIVELDPLAQSRRTLSRSHVDRIEPSLISPMPEGLLQGLQRDEILDLIAFLETAGNPDAPAFHPGGVRSTD
ncbi:MAG: c-type cytochrome, partial [Limisphaerales bacterium]